MCIVWLESTCLKYLQLLLKCHVKSNTFKMLQNVEKLTIFIKESSKAYTLIPSPKLPFVMIHIMMRYILTLLGGWGSNIFHTSVVYKAWWLNARGLKYFRTDSLLTTMIWLISQYVYCLMTLCNVESMILFLNDWVSLDYWHCF